MTADTAKRAFERPSTASMGPPHNEAKVRRERSWFGTLFLLYVHALLVYGGAFLFQAKLLTILFMGFLTFAGLLGVTAGAHRLWAHRSYTANATLRVILMLCHTLVGNGTIHDWVLDHRIHHKFHGTDDDPYNYKKGFFYAQLGHMMLQANPRRQELVKQIDMSDIEEDKVVMFQKRFYYVLLPIVALLFPINTPTEYWGESLLVSTMVVAMLRYPISLHLAWLVNSARTIWGLYPGDRFFSDSNWVYVIKKSYWHEYHYTLPWDYLTNEFGSYNCGCTTVLIKIWAAMGWATNLRTVDSKGVRMALERSVDTGKPIDQCINEVAEDMADLLPEDHYLTDDAPSKPR